MIITHNAAQLNQIFRKRSFFFMMFNCMAGRVYINWARLEDERRRTQPERSGWMGWIRGEGIRSFPANGCEASSEWKQEDSWNGQRYGQMV